MNDSWFRNSEVNFKLRNHNEICKVSAINLRPDGGVPVEVSGRVDAINLEVSLARYVKRDLSLHRNASGSVLNGNWACTSKSELMNRYVYRFTSGY